MNQTVIAPSLKQERQLARKTKQEEDLLAWESAMFAGISGLISYYDPFVELKAMGFVDNSRCTLNLPDLKQMGFMAVVRCWGKQEADRGGQIKNFDMMAKWAVENSYRTAASKEFSPKRGRFHLSFLSELNSGFDDDKDQVDGFEQAVHYLGDDGVCLNGNKSGLCNLVSAICEFIPDVGAKSLFEKISQTENFEVLSPSYRWTPIRRRNLANEIGVPEHEIEPHLDCIHFATLGFQDVITKQKTWR